MTSWNDFLDDYQGQINDWMDTLVDQTGGNNDNINTANMALNSEAFVPEYALEAQAADVDEGAAAVFNLTTNLPEGTIVQVTVSGVEEADIQGPLVRNIAVNADGNAIFGIELLADETTEGEEILTVTVNEAPTVTASVTIIDTSVEGGGGIQLEAGETYTAEAGVAEVFVYEFTDYTAGNYAPLSMVGLDGVITIEGFDPTEDIIRFLDTDGVAPEEAEFLANGYSVTPDAFSNETVVSLVPFQGEDGTAAPEAADIVLTGVVVDTVEIELVG